MFNYLYFSNNFIFEYLFIINVLKLNKNKLYFLLFISFFILEIAHLKTAKLYASNHWVIAEIEIEGNKRTRAEIILREMTVHLGDTIPENKKNEILIRNQQNIYNLGLFNLVQLRDTLMGENQWKIKIHVRERWYFFVSPSLIVEERNSYDVLQKLKGNLGLPLKEWEFPRFSYQMTLMWRNMTGHNERWWFSGAGGIFATVSDGIFLSLAFSESKN